MQGPGEEAHHVPIERSVESHPIEAAVLLADYGRDMGQGLAAGRQKIEMVCPRDNMIFRPARQGISHRLRIIWGR